MQVKEITWEELEPEKFIAEKVAEISSIVGNNIVVVALSGGVDSSTVAVLAHRALRDRLQSCFIDNGLMREGEPQSVTSLFKKIGITVEIIDARELFFAALKGIVDPEKKREAITQTFYKKVFGEIVKKKNIHFILQGTNFTDVEETVAGIKRQHNVLEQLGIDPEKTFGYRVVEPLLQLRKPQIRTIAKALGLPRAIYDRPPFPGPALATRIVGEVTPKKVEVVRKATKIVEDALSNTSAFQYLAILHDDKVTGMKQGKREYGYQVEIRCWDSKDGTTGKPTRLDYEVLDRLSEEITTKLREVVSVTYNITSKPPSTIEAI